MWLIRIVVCAEWSCTVDMTLNSPTSLECSLQSAAFLLHSISLCLCFSQETWLDKTAWAIKATKSPGRRVWHIEAIYQCKVRRQKTECAVLKRRNTHTHMYYVGDTDADNRQPIFSLLSSDSSSPCLLLPSWKFLFVESLEAFASFSIIVRSL